MRYYLGCKLIKAEQMDRDTFTRTIQEKEPIAEVENENGYHVIYPNPNGKEYHSWSPKSIFNSAYREVTDYEMAFVTKTKNDIFLCPLCGEDTLYQEGTSIKCSHCKAEL